MDKVSWRPVRDVSDLPRKEGLYLVSYEKDDKTIVADALYFLGNEKYSPVCLVAWAELPEPYNPKPPRNIVYNNQRPKNCDVYTIYSDDCERNFCGWGCDMVKKHRKYPEHCPLSYNKEA